MKELEDNGVVDRLMKRVKYWDSVELTSDSSEPTMRHLSGERETKSAMTHGWIASGSHKQAWFKQPTTF